MSSLQLSILIGALGVVLAVVVFNAWQARRRRSQGERTLEVLREAISKRVPARGRQARGESATADKSREDAGTRGATRSESSNPGSPAQVDATAEGAARPGDLEGADASSAGRRREFPIDSGAAIEAYTFAATADGAGEGVAAGHPTTAPVTGPRAPALATSASTPGALPPTAGAAASDDAIPGSAAGSLRGEANAAPALNSRGSGGIETTIDLVVGLESWQGWRGDRVVHALQAMRRIGNRPVLVEGQPIGEVSPEWRGLQSEVRYARIRLGLPLVNRSGPLRPTEFSDFMAALHKLRDALGASWIDGTEPRDMHAVLERARRLDAACAALDAQVVINLAFSETISAQAFARMGTRLGLIDRGSTRQARLSKSGDEVFSMGLGERPDCATFMLDVPRVRVDEQPWQQMIDCAIEAAAEFGGQLLDDAGQPLGAHQLTLIAQQLHARQLQLAEAGYPPGSPLALRVFH